MLNASKTPPFYINEDSQIDDVQRLRYRYLDLRREPMQKALRLRHATTRAVRAYLDDNGFIDVETPVLYKSTPEGAREFLVPSRIHDGQFYALPQAPQQFKQLLMVSGFERYFQIARCFRDEDLRADRQPEHTQIDLEWSFIEQEDILQLMEEMYSTMCATIRADAKLPSPFPRLNYDESMSKYGSDKPDLPTAWSSPRSQTSCKKASSACSSRLSPRAGRCAAWRSRAASRSRASRSTS